ncbi:MAG TPA: ABC transporter substrate-binding protein [Mycobacteriales bacterium]|jgi:branched-chain amino acid transport system substrate-binding protein|nr:ABC transporter substrate-binding protein [Mycobacteriales bacterium]
MSERARMTGLCGLAALSLILTACGSGDDAASESPSQAPGASGSAAAPTGQPIVIGMINQENSPAGSFPEIRVADEAAVKYVNSKLGGVNGRPIQLETCITNGSPESSTTCANQFVDKKVLLVTSGVDFGTAASLPILTKAGIPYVGGVPLLPPELTSQNAFMFVGGSTSAFPSQSVFLGREEKAKKVNILYTDNPSGLAAATSYGEKVLKASGVTEVNLVAEKADAADFTAAVTKTAQGNPDAIMVLFSGQGCSRIMQAAGSLGLTSKTKFYYPGSCVSSNVIKAGGSGAEGARFNTETVLLGDNDPQIKIFLEAMKAGAPANAELSSFAQTGFAAIMNIHALLSEMAPDQISSTAVVTALRATKEKPNFMSHPYTCDGKQVPGLPAVCDSYSKIIEYKGGKQTYLYNDWLTGADKLGS